jgi:hypothetical protein
MGRDSASVISDGGNNSWALASANSGDREGSGVLPAHRQNSRCCWWETSEVTGLSDQERLVAAIERALVRSADLKSVSG